MIYDFEDDRQEGQPTLAEIEQLCAEIQAKWSPRVRRFRKVQRDAVIMPHEGRLGDAFGNIAISLDV